MMKPKIMGLILFLWLLLGFGVGCKSIGFTTTQIGEGQTGILVRTDTFVGWYSKATQSQNKASTTLSGDIGLLSGGDSNKAAIKPEDDPLLDPNASPSPGGR